MALGKRRREEQTAWVAQPSGGGLHLVGFSRPQMLQSSTTSFACVPALAGLGAPHWDPYARGTIVGITRGTTGGRQAVTRMVPGRSLSRGWKSKRRR